jgi:hypothetical protein
VEEYLSSNDVTQLANSGWKRSAWDRRRLVQKSSDKLHFFVQFTRYDEADKKMASYEALYILTLKDARLGGAGTVKLPGYNCEGLRLLSPLEGMTASAADNPVPNSRSPVRTVSVTTDTTKAPVAAMRRMKERISCLRCAGPETYEAAGLRLKMRRMPPLPPSLPPLPKMLT